MDQPTQSQTTQKLRDFARNLIVYETSGRRISKAKDSPSFLVTEKLRPHLTNLMGKGGFRALLARALALTNMEVSWLNAVKVNPDGALEGLEALHSQVNSAEFFEGKVVFLTHLLGLLIALIGPDLTIRLLSEIWPKLHLTLSLSVEGEEQNEKAK